MPYLWKDLIPYGRYHNLEHFLGPIAPSRRQFYAGFIENATASSCYDADEDDHSPLKGTIFPRLTSLTLCVDLIGYYVPRIQASRLRILDIDPRHEPTKPVIVLGAEMMEEVMEQIPDIFPDVEELRFIDTADLTHDIARMLRERLPKLKVLDLSMCGITHV
ncbi:hypothetical protein P170DRAFT_511170 [Aspergillus steynii IBT 23096]|uniref:F-box domain-containing protein n=1 Tax=Aspergillus steynii IBT 23096 TaxID=1392250 RepID=A0A2I2G0J9_9EURO|nr:uncharacterized protein P170DRAFT_511170 [Aspergillus steynii IBT 23096]PLB46393.1 hypothetical protein P170DRAFT_511170 [Aspergillus steynii IBT 23096]